MGECKNRESVRKRLKVLCGQSKTTEQKYWGRRFALWPWWLLNLYSYIFNYDFSIFAKFCFIFFFHIFLKIRFFNLPSAVTLGTVKCFPTKFSLVLYLIKYYDLCLQLFKNNSTYYFLNKIYQLLRLI